MANKTVYREPFAFAIAQLVWEKAEIVPGLDPNVYRKDTCGALIRRDLLGNCTTGLSMGWEIDHIKPVEKGGTDELVNLQPLQWENNRHKSDSYPSWDCFVSTQETRNVYTKIHQPGPRAFATEL